MNIIRTLPHFFSNARSNTQIQKIAKAPHLILFVDIHDTIVAGQSARHLSQRNTSNVKDNNVFSSFIYMIAELETKRRPFSLIFRSFGDDTVFALKEIEMRAGIKLEHRSRFQANHLLHGNHVLTKPEQMLSIIEPGKHGKWVDDFHHWNNNGRNHHAGKIYPLDSGDLLNTLTIFFDDDTRNQKIINICDLSATNTSQQERQAQLLEEGRLVHVETLAAKHDEEYFINHVNAALDFRNRWIPKNMNVNDRSAHRPG